MFSTGLYIGYGGGKTYNLGEKARKQFRETLNTNFKGGCFLPMRIASGITGVKWRDYCRNMDWTLQRWIRAEMTKKATSRS